MLKEKFSHEKLANKWEGQEAIWVGMNITFLARMKGRYQMIVSRDYVHEVLARADRNLLL